MKKLSQKNLRVPYGLSVHGKEEITAVVEVLKGNTALGDRTREFEERVAKLFGKKYGVMVNSGSSANLLAFEILNLPKGSEVITPLLTFSTTVAPIVQKDLVPVFVDVDADTYLINISQLEKAISKKTKALMIPSLLGNIPNLKRLKQIADRHHLWLIEDSCDTLGGKFLGKPTGVYTHITTTSFYGSHIINGAGGGGMICVNDPEWADRLIVLRGWGRQSSLFGEKQDSEILANRFRSKIGGVPYDNKFIFSEVGYNFLPLEISSAFGLEQLKKLPRFAKVREQNFQKLFKFFKKREKYFSLPKTNDAADTVWLAFPVIIKPNAPFSRLNLVTFLENANIQTRPIFTGNILKQPGFSGIRRRLAVKNYPHTEQIMKFGMVLGCHQGLNARQMDYMQKNIKVFLSRFR